MKGLALIPLSILLLLAAAACAAATPTPTPTPTLTPASGIAATPTPTPAGMMEPTPTPTATPTPPPTNMTPEPTPSPSTPRPTPTSTPTPGPTMVQISVSAQDVFFVPATLDFGPGDTVDFTVTNDGGLPHTFTIALASDQKDTVFIDLSLSPGETITGQLTMPQEVTSLYLFCRFHEAAGMVGTVNVGTPPAEGTPPPSTPDYYY
ncbi:MAG: plastocyanin/azurin family copper-binding protein [Dehalococcoidia bacterium]